LFFPNWIVGLSTTNGGEGGFFILQVFQHWLVLKMLNEGVSLRDLKGKIGYQSRGEKHQRELKAKKESAQCYAGAFGSSNDGDKPSDECKSTIFQALY
jgi:hypothetical protein